MSAALTPVWNCRSPQESKSVLVTTHPPPFALDLSPELFLSRLHTGWLCSVVRFLCAHREKQRCLRRRVGSRRSLRSSVWRRSSSPTASFSGWVGKRASSNNGLGAAVPAGLLLKSRPGHAQSGISFNGNLLLLLLFVVGVFAAKYNLLTLPGRAGTRHLFTVGARKVMLAFSSASKQTKSWTICG